ncbi:hypothetical protein ACP70R_036696 [Stipagrostis hirtigluma subsp. patula]
MFSAPLLSSGGAHDDGQERRPTATPDVATGSGPRRGSGAVGTEEAWVQLQFAVPMILTSMSLLWHPAGVRDVLRPPRPPRRRHARQLLGHRHRLRPRYRPERRPGDAVRAGLRLRALVLHGAAAPVASPESPGRRGVPRGGGVRAAPDPRPLRVRLRECQLRYLQAQSAVAPLVVCSAAPFALHVALAHLLVNVIGLGLSGAGAAVSATFWVSCMMLLAFVLRSGTWNGFSAEAFRYVLPTVKLAAPSAVMVCLEIWAFELLVLVAGLLPDSTVSTSLIAMCSSTEAIAFMITYGFSAAVSTRVSNEIGAGDVEKAKNAVSVTMKLSVLLATTFVLLLAFGHDLWAGLFSGSVRIVSAFAAITPLMIISIVLDSAQGVLSGVSRGCGWQHLGAMTNLVAFVGVPLAVLFAFKLELYAKGLWAGLICGLACQACSLLAITVRTKWSKIAEAMQEQKANHVA